MGKMLYVFCHNSYSELFSPKFKLISHRVWLHVQDLIVDQTIEKVSFCAPDRNYDKAFSYICRDGTTRRWMCHCFMALKDSVSASNSSKAQMR